MVDFEFIKNNFIQEAGELIENLESQLLILEKEPGNSAVIQEIFRITHTLKGSAAMFGFEKTGKMAHHLENIYDSIRKGTLQASEKIITVTLRAADFLKLMLNKNEHFDPQEAKEFDLLFDEIKETNNKKPEKEENKGDVTVVPTVPAASDDIRSFFIHFKPDKDIFVRGINPYDVFEDFKLIGMYHSDPDAVKPDEIKETEKKEFTADWKIYLCTRKNEEDLRYLFFFFNENEFKIFPVDPENISKEKEFKKYYSDTFRSVPDLSFFRDIFSELIQSLLQKNDAQHLANENESDAKENGIPENKEKPASKRAESIRVSSAKLDELINLVSELVLINAHLSFLVKDIQDVQLKKTIGTLEKLYKQLRNNALELRLVPLKSITLKFHRMVRDLAGRLNKDVDLVVIGENTELDSNMISMIESPLMHIIRNSMDHGIEDPETRMKLGKQPKGIIRLISFYSGANVFIQVQDDGKGIDSEYIRKKAVERGIISATDKPTEEEIYDIIFLPGFSTAQDLSEVSGRGVGMDVVKKNIQELRGTIEIDSEKGLGTSVSLKLPLTLSIIDTLQVVVDNRCYLIPLDYIDSCHKITHAEINASGNRHVEFNNDILPFIYLREYFTIRGDAPEIENLIILKHNEKKYGLVADKVIGEHQAVVKPLGQIHKNQEYLTGAGILGNGKLALILDTNKLISTIKKEAIYNG